MQSTCQVSKDESELTSKRVTGVALAAETGLSRKPDSFCFHGNPAPGREVGRKGPRTLSSHRSLFIT